jgi:hypothetical protein
MNTFMILARLLLAIGNGAGLYDGELFEPGCPGQGGWTWKHHGFLTLSTKPQPNDLWSFGCGFVDRKKPK